MNPFDPDALLDALPCADGAAWRDWLAANWQAYTRAERNADVPRWQAAVASLPTVLPSRVSLAADTVVIGEDGDIDETQRDRLVAGLRELHPWRKGPFDFFGTHVDTEWRSDWKWRRVAPHVSPLVGRRVLDVGCGSGYHLWRMRGDGATFVLGIDPAMLYFAQFAAVKRYLPEEWVFFAPVKLEDLPRGGAQFDTVFSMGVLYHRREPLVHLAELRDALRPGGELVLESLVLDGDEHGLLQPADRYAQMRNVMAIPGTATLVDWVTRAGFADARLVDISRTTTDEQRRTPWMTFQSLADFLDPADPSRTIEGHPAPVRAVVIARKPG